MNSEIFKNFIKSKKIDLIEWLPKAASQTTHIKRTTHPPKFTHPSSDTSKIICDINNYKSDGLLKCGNVKKIDIDADLSAAYLKVYDFLNLILEDGKKVFEHILENTSFAKRLLNISGYSADDLRTKFLKFIISNDKPNKTDYRIKQVYFPIGKHEYHLLSILTNSGIVFELKNRINILRSNAKNTRKNRKDNEYIEPSYYREMFDLTIIGYGGTKFQNISGLNNRNKGKAYLLPSLPPKIERRKIRFPKKDFFSESLPYRKVWEILKSLYAIITTDYNNADIRRGRKYRYEQLVDLIIMQMMRVRSVSSEQYREEDSRLPEYQKIWLCEQYKEQRETQDKWLDELIDHISRWILHQIERISRREGLKLGSGELTDIRKIVETSKEALR